MEERPEEVRPQEPTQPEETQAPEARPYVPRPRWQVWLARVGLVVFVLFLIAYYVNIFRGGR